MMDTSTTSPILIALGSGLLIAGCLVCLIAAIGVLRLPDIFMRLHAATKSGFVGCGLVLIGLALIDSSTGTTFKVLLTLAFLLITTPLAGHLLGRAAYVGGTPMWSGTRSDALARVLERRRFDGPRDGQAIPTRSAGGPAASAQGPALGRASADAIAGGAPIDTVVLALIDGPTIDRAVDSAISLARQQGAELHGIAVIDAPRLANVGPIPIGAGWHAQSMRERRLRLAREAAARAIQRFEARAASAGLVWSVRLEEGRPAAIFATTDNPGTVLAVAGQTGFDQGVLELRTNLMRRLGRGRRGPIVQLA